MLYRSRKQGTRFGVATAELALLLPFLMFMWVIALDWARIFYFTVTLEYAARDGAYYACNYDSGLYGTSSASAEALAQAVNINPAPTVTSYYTTAADPNGAGWTSFTGTTPSNATFVKVNVTYDFTTITNFPGVPSSQTISRDSIMRYAPATPN